MALDFYIQIETPAGVVVGPGPIISATGWTYTGRMDRAGDFSFNMPASDPLALYVTEKRRVRAFALLNNVWTEIGDGIIDQIDTSLDDATMLAISGPDGAGELAGYLAEGVTLSNITTGVAEPASYAIDALATAATSYAGTTWTFTRTDITAAELYGAFYDETILQALGIVAEKSGGHFYYAGNRTINFFTGFTSSGVRAIDADGDLAAETCAITSCKKSVETHELITRVMPRGGGNGNARIDLRACTRSQPTGYTLNTTSGWLRKDAAYASYGTIDRKVEWKDIVPFRTNTDADLQNAANALFDVAKIYLDVYSVRATSYDLTVAGCSQRLRPGQTIRVDYYDPLAGIIIAEDLYIIEATLSIDDNELQTTQLTVSTQARWPLTDGEVLASQIAEGRIFRANPQTGPNAYAIAYTKNVDDTETASFAFGFGAEVVQLQSVVFDFQLLPFESTVKAVAAQSMTGGAGELLTNGATGTSGIPANNTSGTSTGDSGASTGNSGASTGDSGAASGGTAASTGDSGTAAGGSGAPSNNASSAPSSNASGAPSNNASSAPSNNASSTPSTNDSGAPSTADTGASGALATGVAQGGDVVDAQGRHRHNITVTTIGGPGTTVALISGNQLYSTSSGVIESTVVGEHTHALASHTHNLSSHTHTLNSHTHNLNSHTHDLNNHTHTLNSHTHDLNNHTHSLNNHTHSLNAHTHSLNSHTHGLNSHTHSLNAHTHSLNAHTHSLNSHTHTLNNHTHTLTPTIEAVYGIFRESALNTYAITDLEYRVNALAWADLIGATSLGGGWYRLGITASVYSSTTFRPLQERNTLQIRRKAVAVASKTVTVDAQLFIRQTIQAIAYS